jgi:multicomponent Na+:H+ antiporter subunit B
MVSPFIMMYALYVVFHGHYSPGGGFQGGTMMAASILLIRLTAGTEIAQLQFKRHIGTLLGSIGVLIYFGTGLAALLLGGNFLEYKFINPANEVMSRYWGTLMVEIGVSLGVMGIMITVYDDLLEGDPND